MKENPLKASLKSGGTALGVLAPIYDPAIVETCGHLGFDFYMLDCEHGAGGPIQAEQVVRACEPLGLTPLVRARSTDPKLLLQFMDSGMLGVMMPGINDADDVRRLVDAVKYPPTGKRGIGPVRANDYLIGHMSQAEYVALANAQTMLLPQVETVEAVRNIESLVRVEGIDGFIVGPRDLSMAMGFKDGPAHEEVWKAVYDVFQAVRGAGLAVGTTAGTGEEARRHIERGANIILGSVNWLLRVGAEAFFSAARPSPTPNP